MKNLIIVIFCTILCAKGLENQYIVHGEDATRPIPYHAHIQLKDIKGKNRFGSGALLNRRFVVTVAQNLKNRQDVFTPHQVGFGSIKLADLKFYKVSDQYIHEKYDPETLFHNIALLELDQSIDYTEKIHPIPINLFESIAEGVHGEISGFGFTHNTPSTISLVLQMGKQEIISEAACIDTFPHMVNESENLFCALNSDKKTSICGGDQGGPFVVDIPNFGKYLVGLSSFIRTSNCINEHPAAYVKIHRYFKFINDIINKQF